MTFRIDKADCLEWLRAMPPDSADLIFGSPPYEKARKYLENGDDLGIARDTESWVAWMVDVVRESVRVSRGLVAFVVEGQTRDYKYSCGPALLMADLHRAGFNLRKPAVFHRVGIPGSGGPDWLRNDFEFIICVTKPGKLPWSDNTACGHTPKWAPGGEMSYRTLDGERVNAKPKTMGELMHDKGGNRRAANGTREKMGQKVSGRQAAKDAGIKLKTTTSGTDANGTMTQATYLPPTLANPGNVLKLSLTLAELIGILIDYEQTTNSTADQVLRDLQQANSAGNLCEWFYGVCLQIQAAAFLRIGMRGVGKDKDSSNSGVSAMRPANHETERRIDSGILNAPVLQSPMPREDISATGRPKARRVAAQRTEDCETNDSESGVRSLRTKEPSAHSSSRRGCDEQQSEQSPSALLVVSSKDSQDGRLQSRKLWGTVPGSRILQQTLPQIQEVWRSVAQMFGPKPADESSNLIKCNVGGGLMGGDQFSSCNEAPFPESLCEFFIRSFAPPAGIVIDPFSGSGTTAAVAIRHGRNFLGCDIRQSMVDLGMKRIQQETPLGLFAEDA